MDETDEQGKAFPLFVAADGRTAKVLLDARAAVDPPDKADITTSAFHAAVREGRCSTLEELMNTKYKTKLHEKDGSDLYPIHMATNNRVLSILLKGRADVTVTNGSKETPLHLIVRYNTENSVAAVEMMLKARSDPRAEDSHGRTPLGNVSSAPVVQLLLEGEADLLHKDHEGVPMGLKCALNPENLSVALAKGLPRDTCCPQTGVNLVHVALCAAEPIEQNTPEAIQLLLNEKVDIFASQNTKSKQSTLHEVFDTAVRPEVMLLVLDELLRIDDGLHQLKLIEEVNEEGTVFHRAVQCDMLLDGFAKTRFLQQLDPRRKIMLQDKDMQCWPICLLLDTCKELAAKDSRIDITPIINIESPKDIGGGRIDRRTPLAMLSTIPPTTYFDEDAISTIQKRHVTDVAVIAMLLDAGANPQPALDYYIEIEDVQMVKVLLDGRANINANINDGYGGEGFLHDAILRGDVPLAEEWRNLGANVHVLDRHGHGLETYARHRHSLTFLSDCKVDINRQNKDTGDTLLHKFAKQGSQYMLAHLLNNLRAKTILNSSQQSALHVATEAGHIATMSYLINEGFDFSAGDREGQRPIHIACKAGSAPAVELVLSMRANVNAPNDAGETPLMQAIRGSNFHLFHKLILEHKADIRKKTANLHTALHVAAAGGCHRELDFLLQQELINVNCKTSDLKQSALHVAVENGNLACMEALLKHPQIEFEAEDAKGQTCLSIVAKCNNKRMFDSLRNSKWSAASANKAFFEALERGNTIMFQALITDLKLKPCDCMVVRSRNNAFHTCAHTGNEELTEYLLDNWGEDVLVALKQPNEDLADVSV